MNNTQKTPGYNSRIAIFFQSDKNGRKLAYYWSGRCGYGRAIRMSLKNAEMFVAQDLADLLPGHPLKEAPVQEQAPVVEVEQEEIRKFCDRCEQMADAVRMQDDEVLCEKCIRELEENATPRTTAYDYYDNSDDEPYYTSDEENWISYNTCPTCGITYELGIHECEQTPEQEQSLTLHEALQQAQTVYKISDNGYYSVSRANFGGGYFKDYKSFDPAKHSSVATSQHYNNLQQLAYIGEEGWQLDRPSQPTPEQQASNTLDEKIINKETVTVEVASTGKRFSIRYHHNDYGIPAYDVIDDKGTLQKNGVMLSREEVRNWCVGLVEVGRVAPVIVLENIVQQDYREAKQDYEARLKLVAQEIEPLFDVWQFGNEEDLEAYCDLEAEIHTKYGTLQATQKLQEAENELLAWGHQVARQDKRYKRNQELLEKLFATNLLKYRDQVINLCLRLDPEAKTSFSNSPEIRKIGAFLA